MSLYVGKRNNGDRLAREVSEWSLIISASGHPEEKVPQ
jgi:hypothetical protein